MRALTAAVESDAASLAEIYGQMLERAVEQTHAIEMNDLTRFDMLAAQRAHLVAASERALASGVVADAEQAASLIRSILNVDAHTAELIEAQRHELQREAGEYRKTVFAIAGYQVALATPGYLVDSRR